jgi:hypothetical protein
MQGCSNAASRGPECLRVQTARAIKLQTGRLPRMQLSQRA